MSEESPRAEMTPTVSVIVASYNASRYIAHAISSIQKQTLRNIEIIVSDDASTDDSVEIVTRLMSDDARIRLVRGARNCGPAVFLRVRILRTWHVSRTAPSSAANRKKMRDRTTIG